MEFYAIMPDGSVITAKTQEELTRKIKEYRENS